MRRIATLVTVTLLLAGCPSGHETKQCKDGTLVSGRHKDVVRVCNLHGGIKR